MPTITEADLKTVMSREGFGNLYYFCGDEKMLVAHYTKMFIEKTAGKEPDDFNFHMFTDSFSVNEFEAAVLMLPFSSKYNVVVVKDIEMRSFNSSDASRILDIASNAGGGTILLFTFPTKSDFSDDKQQGTKKTKPKDKQLKELVSKKGTIVEFKAVTPENAKSKVVSWAKKVGVQISPQTARLLVEYCGTDLNRLRTELHKLTAYAGEGGEITPETVEKLVTRDLENKVFDLSNAVIGHRAADAFRILNTLLYNREDEQKILATLANAYVNIYRVRIAIKSGERSIELKKWFTYSDAQLRYAERDSQKTTTAALRKSLDAIAETDIAMKSTRTSKRLLLEVLIEKLLIIASEYGRRY